MSVITPHSQTQERVGNERGSEERSRPTYSLKEIEERGGWELVFLWKLAFKTACWEL